MAIFSQLLQVLTFDSLFEVLYIWHIIKLIGLSDCEWIAAIEEELSKYFVLHVVVVFYYEFR